MAGPSVTYTFTNGTTADASQVSQNFTDLINGMTDGTKSFAISALSLASTLTANANVVLGASSSNTITVIGSIASAVPFSANTSWDLGGATLGAKSLYLGGSSTYTVRVLAATMSASYTLTLPPAVPATSGSLLQMDTSGNVTLTLAPSVTTITTSGIATIGGNATVAGTLQIGGGPILSSSGGQLIGNVTQFFLDGTSAAGFEVINNKTIAVRSSGAVSNDIVTSPHPSVNGLSLVRGTITWSGSAWSVTTGEGFTVSGSATTATCTFSTAFNDSATCSATMDTTTGVNVRATGTTTVATLNFSSGVGSGTIVNVIAIAQRGA